MRVQHNNNKKNSSIIEFLTVATHTPGYCPPHYNGPLDIRAMAFHCHHFLMAVNNFWEQDLLNSLSEDEKDGGRAKNELNSWD